MVEITDYENSKYICSKCLYPPIHSQEVLKGCSRCGNKLFTLRSNVDQKSLYNKKTENSRSDENEELTKVSIISIPKNGVFEIDVEALLKKDDPEPIPIVDNKGKIYLNL